MSETITVTLPASADWKDVHSRLNSDTGGYAKFFFYYVMTRNGVQQVGEVDINDNGLQTQMDHEFSIVPVGDDTGVSFRVAHVNGVRTFQYQTTGAGNTTFKAKIEHTIA